LSGVKDKQRRGNPNKTHYCKNTDCAKSKFSKNLGNSTHTILNIVSHAGLSNRTLYFAIAVTIQDAAVLKYLINNFSVVAVVIVEILKPCSNIVSAYTVGYKLIITIL
jgi:hypothetical protein